MIAFSNSMSHESLNPSLVYEEIKIALQVIDDMNDLEEVRRSINQAVNTMQISSDQRNELQALFDACQKGLLSAEFNRIAAATSQQELTNVSLDIRARFEKGAFPDAQFHILESAIERRTDNLVRENMVHIQLSK